MPAKFINNQTWHKVEKKLVEGVIVTKTSMKDADIIKLLLEIGMKNIKDDDYIEWMKSKNKN